MKVWNNPKIWQLGVEMTAGTGNEEYTDPSAKPSDPDHSNWVWCYKHARWHPMDHS